MATFHATVMVRSERQGKGLAPTAKLFEQARKIKGVTDAFPTLGRFDGAVFIEGRTYEETANAALKVQTLNGVRSTETLLQLP